MLYYLLNESDSLNEGRFWSIINQEFSSEVEDKIMTIAQKLEARGMEKGIEKGKVEIATRLLRRNQDIDFISNITEFSLEKIKKLQEEFQH